MLQNSETYFLPQCKVVDGQGTPWDPHLLLLEPLTFFSNSNVRQYRVFRGHYLIPLGQQSGHVLHIQLAHLLTPLNTRQGVPVMGIVLI